MVTAADLPPGAAVSANEVLQETFDDEVETVSPEPAPVAAEPDVDAPSATEVRHATRKLVSAPILHLKRRSRALAEILEWREEDEDWSEEVLTHCAETAEALRDLVAAGPTTTRWPTGCAMRSIRPAIPSCCCRSRPGRTRPRMPRASSINSEPISSRQWLHEREQPHRGPFHEAGSHHRPDPGRRRRRTA
jgi:hypothetical protein